MYCGSCQHVFLSVLNEVIKYILYSTLSSQSWKKHRVQLFTSLVEKRIVGYFA